MALQAYLKTKNKNDIIYINVLFHFVIKVMNANNRKYKTSYKLVLVCAAIITMAVNTWNLGLKS